MKSRRKGRKRECLCSRNHLFDRGGLIFPARGRQTLVLWYRSSLRDELGRPEFAVERADLRAGYVSAGIKGAICEWK